MENQVKKRRAKRSQRGLTLVEIAIATTVALILTAAAVAFATQETRLMDVSQERLEMSQVGRSALALLADDIRKAGAGIGYDEQGRFRGILADGFTMGGLLWNPSGTPIAVGAGSPFPVGSHTVNGYTRPRAGQNRGQTYSVVTHDIGFVYADGTYATIVDERNFTGTVCTEPLMAEYQANELVVMRDAIGISAMSGRINITGLNLNCPCEDGCTNFTFAPTTDFSSGPGAARASYRLGEIQGGLKTAVWFVAEVNGEGQLRRAEFTGDPLQNCADRATCGGLVADYTEALYTQIWRWDDNNNQWAQGGQSIATTDPSRMRIDVELILRSQSETSGDKPVVTSKLQFNTCIPGPTCDDVDRYARVAYRTTIEVMNSRLMRMR